LGQKKVIFSWFASFANFRVKSHAILSAIFLSCIDWKQ